MIDIKETWYWQKSKTVFVMSSPCVLQSNLFCMYLHCRLCWYFEQFSWKAEECILLFCQPTSSSSVCCSPFCKALQMSHRSWPWIHLMQLFLLPFCYLWHHRDSASCPLRLSAIFLFFFSTIRYNQDGFSCQLCWKVVFLIVWVTEVW